MGDLLVISSSPVRLGASGFDLDVKFVEGMKFYVDSWQGRVGCMLWHEDGLAPFMRHYDNADLPFELIVKQPGQTVATNDLAGYDVILCSGDDYRILRSIASLDRLKHKFVFIIEYIFETRVQILMLDRSRGLLKKSYSVAIAAMHELQRRRIFRHSNGIQANGYPAYQAYKPLNPETILFLDGRLGNELIASDSDMALKRARLASGAPLRILHSGRLEPLKGAQDLVPVARHLAGKGMDFEMEIFGSGSLEAEIRRDIREAGLGDRIRLNGPVDFETQLVPFAKQNADIFLSCHRQSDPSCTYLESMGCGLAIAGYANRMWSTLCDESLGGWKVGLGDVNALADQIFEANRDRDDIADRCDAARAFAASHTFEREFRLRIAHLERIVGQ